MKKIVSMITVAAFFFCCFLHGSSGKLTTDASTSSSDKYASLSVSNIPSGVNVQNYYQELQRDLYFPKTLPTTSINEDAIEATFGPNGANLDSTLVTRIKQAYCYLEFLYKLDQVQNNTAYSSYKSDFSSYLDQESSQQSFLPTTDLVASNGWKSIATTGQDLMESTPWQQFVKTMITNCFINDYTTIEILHQVKTQIFYYIPHIETSYYTSDFTNLRTLEEVTRIKTLLHSNMRQFYLTQCTEWKNEVTSTLGSDIVAFKNDTFYTTVNPSTATSSTGNANSSSLVNTNLVQQSPLREELWCYFMFKNLIADLYAALSLENLNSIIKTITSTDISPCFSDLNTADLAILYDFYMLQKDNEASSESSSSNISETNSSTTSTNSSLSSSKNKILGKLGRKKERKRKWKPEELRHPHTFIYSRRNHPFTKKDHPYNKKLRGETNDNNTVIAQDFWSDVGDFFTDAGNSISQALDEAWDGMQSAADAVVDFTESAANTIVGWGATIVGDIAGDQSIISWGENLEDKGVQEAQKGLQDLTAAVDDFSAAIEDGIVAPIADVTGAITTVITGDIQAGKDMQGVVNDVGDAIQDFIDNAADLAINTTGDLIITEIQISEDITNVIVSGVMTILTMGQDGNYVSDLTEESQRLVTDTATNLINLCQTVYDYGKETFESLMTVLSTIVNSITTVFIDTVREITYIGSSIAEGLGANVDPDEVRDSITETLEESRQTINQVVGVVLAVAVDVVVTVATMGAGDAALVEIDAALIGGTEAAEAGAEVGVEAGAEIGEIGAEGGEEIANAAADAAADTIENGTSDVLEDSTWTDDIDNVDEADEVEETDENSEENKEEAEEDNEDEDNNENSDNKSKIKEALSKFMKFFSSIMNVGFGSFNVISGMNADQQNALQKKQQERMIQNTWRSIQETKIYMIQNQSAFIDELAKKYAAEIGNKKLGLIYYKNYLNASIDNTQSIISEDIAVEQINYLTPETNGLSKANIGTSWGLETPFLNLYPSQGFISATTGRADFPYAQEIAQAPLSSTSSSSTDKVSNSDNSNGEFSFTGDAASMEAALSDSTTDSSEKFWFNQRTIANLDQDATDKASVEMKFNVIYTLDSAFHFGMYVGGTYYDYTSTDYLNKLKTTQSADLDAIHLAKLFVMYRNSASDNWNVGVYEPEGAGWIVQEELDSTMYDQHYTYHMSAELDGTSLTVSLWKESDTSTKWTKTITVSETDQRPYGTIFSGAAIEWGVVSPTVSNTVNSAARPALALTPEVQRSKTAIAARQQNLAPTFGSIELTAITNRQALNQLYLYQTSSTDLTDFSGKALQSSDGTTLYDEVVFATNTNGTLSNIGTTPSNSNANVIVSLISGNVYDSSGTLLYTQSGVWNSYKATKNVTDQTLSTYIDNTQSIFLSSLQAITIGSISLAAVSLDDLENGQFVYTSTDTITEQNADGSAITDYLTPCSLTTDNKLGTTFGMAPNSSTQGLISLVTGNVFDTTGTVIDSGYAILSTYESEYGNLSLDIENAISTSESNYYTASEAAEAAAETTVLGTGTSESDVSSSGDSGNGTGFGGTEYSLNDRAKSAAGNDWPF